MELLFTNYYQLEITCADPADAVSRLTDAGVRMRDIEQMEQWKIRLSVSGRHMGTVQSVGKRLGYDVRVTGQRGPMKFWRFLKKRSIFVGGILLLTVLTLWIPTRVFFVEVEGNSTLETTHILEKAEQVGISFGASRRSVRSEKVKNALLEASPQLKWAGINTYGCRAVISVIERDQASPAQASNNAVLGIYALSDGIVSSITVTKGTGLCAPGQAISTGQLLISGYTDCGLVIRAERAEGEVFALTQRKIQAVMPRFHGNNRIVQQKNTRWRLQFGKKQIKLYIGSGNYDTQCGKIYESYDLTLPGGFRLPISVVKETVITYGSAQEETGTSHDILRALSADHISRSMVAGKILRTDFSVETQADLYTLRGVCICNEMVGKLQNEEIRQIDD